MLSLVISSLKSVCYDFSIFYAVMPNCTPTPHSLATAGSLISNIDIAVDIIDDTFDVSISISTILSYKSIDRGIDDTLLAFFYRHYIDTSQLTCKMMHITI